MEEFLFFRGFPFTSTFVLLTRVIRRTLFTPGCNNFPSTFASINPSNYLSVAQPESPMEMKQLSVKENSIGETSVQSVEAATARKTKEEKNLRTLRWKFLRQDSPGMQNRLVLVEYVLLAESPSWKVSARRENLAAMQRQVFSDPTPKEIHHFCQISKSSGLRMQMARFGGDCHL